MKVTHEDLAYTFMIGEIFLWFGWWKVSLILLLLMIRDLVVARNRSRQAHVVD